MLRSSLEPRRSILITAKLGGVNHVKPIDRGSANQAGQKVSWNVPLWSRVHPRFEMQRPRPPSQGLPKVVGSQLGQDPLVQRSQEDFQLFGPTWANFSLIRRKCFNIIFLNYHMPPEIRSVKDHSSKICLIIGVRIGWRWFMLLK